MSVSRVEGHATSYHVDSSRLRCSRSTAGCGFDSDSPVHADGAPCPKCKEGFLEREQYLVDLASLNCGCEDANVGKTSRLARGKSKVERWRERLFCKHVKACVIHLQTEDMDLFEVLAALPGQNQNNGP